MKPKMKPGLKSRPQGASARPRLILASASASRRTMLQRAGIACDFAAADIDEAAVKRQMQRRNAAPERISEHLAYLKARAVSRKNPGRLVLGADQLLVCDERIFDKPRDMDEVADHLRFFRGRSHYLHTSYALVQDLEARVIATKSPRLVMRDFSEDFLRRYLEISGEKILGSVGCYLLEDMGPQLFSEINGDYFTILGLPLLEVMDNLREMNILQA